MSRQEEHHEASEQHRLVRQGLKLSHLRLVALLEETGQISGAAAHLAVSQPAASRMLADIEAILGAKLYTRHSRGVVLNDVGRMLAARARMVLRQLEETDEEIASFIAGRRGRVDLGSVTGPTLELVLPAIRQARITHPDLEINVIVDTSDKLGEALLAGNLDFYIGRVLDNIDPRAVTIQTIGEEPVGLIVRPEHPLVGRVDFSLRQCLHYDWVMQPPGGLLRRTVETYLLEDGYNLPERIVSTSSILVTLALIAGSNAIAPVARSVADFYGGEGGRVKELPLGTYIKVSPYSFIRRRDEGLSAPARAFYGILLGHLSNAAAVK